MFDNILPAVCTVWLSLCVGKSMIGVSTPSFGFYKCGGGRFCCFEWQHPVHPESSKQNQNSTSAILYPAGLFKVQSISSVTLLLLRYRLMLVSRENVVLTWEARLANKQTTRDCGLIQSCVMGKPKQQLATTLRACAHVWPCVEEGHIPSRLKTSCISEHFFHICDVFQVTFIFSSKIHAENIQIKCN